MFMNTQVGAVTDFVFGAFQVKISADEQNPLNASIKLMEIGTGLVIGGITLAYEVYNGEKFLSAFAKPNLLTWAVGTLLTAVSNDVIEYSMVSTLYKHDYKVQYDATHESHDIIVNTNGESLEDIKSFLYYSNVLKESDDVYVQRGTDVYKVVRGEEYNDVTSELARRGFFGSTDASDPYNEILNLKDLNINPNINDYINNSYQYLSYKEERYLLVKKDSILFPQIGNANDNIIYGDNNARTLYGDLGKDYIVGGNQNDTIYGDKSLYYNVGENGNDTLIGGDGSDEIHGEGGNDIIYGDRNLIYGQDDDYPSEIITDPNHVIDYQDLKNFETGNDGVDKIYGDDGNDFIVGGGGNDIIDGGADKDTIYGGSGGDSIIGGTGDDVIIGGAGADTISGGRNNDIIIGDYTNLPINELENIKNTINDDKLLEFETFGDASANTLNGDAGDDFIIGGAGNDIISGGNDKDTIYGGSGNDTIYGGQGNDKLYGDFEYATNDTEGTNEIHGGTGNDTISGSGKLYGDIGNDFIYGSTLNDTIDGGNGDDYIMGEEGNDNIKGGFGNDEIYGGTGTDIIYGQGGNDIIDGGGGIDTMIGGAGYDTYFLDNADDVITENADGGIDKVYSSISYTLGNNIEDLELTGTENINASGNALSNHITGNAGNNTLTGGDGDDYFIGNGGNDKFIGGEGTDHYNISTSSSTTIIHDSDGKGVITYGTNPFVNPISEVGSFAGDHSGNNGIYGADGQFVWSGIDDSTLTINIDNNTILIENFSNGNFGINLFDNSLGMNKGSDNFVSYTSVDFYF